MIDVAKGDAFLQSIKEEKGQKHAEAIKFVVEATEPIVLALRLGIPTDVRGLLAAQAGTELAGYFMKNFGELKGDAFRQKASDVRTDVVRYLVALGRLDDGTRWDEESHRIIEPDGNKTGLGQALAKSEPIYD